MSRKTRDTTLLWEALREPSVPQSPDPCPSGNGGSLARARRLPFERQCAAITRSGRRCRGRIRDGSEFCPFHDPALSAERRREIAAHGGRNAHRLSRLPDGYLRKLTTRRAVGDAMDRLYREVRLEIITPEMGNVLFNVLTRVLDSGLCASDKTNGSPKRKSKADQIRPKLSDLLTRADREAWQQAVSAASK